MRQNKSESIAFFSILRELIAPQIKNEELNYNISISDLANKMDMDKKIISKFLNKLNTDGLVKIENIGCKIQDDISIVFNNTHDKLLEIVSVEGIDKKISDLSDFIIRKLSYFTLNKNLFGIEKYAKEIKERIDRDGEAGDIHDLIAEGIKSILGDKEKKRRLNRIIFEIAKDADEADLKELEEILYYEFNLPEVENPFYVTLFLTGVSYKLQQL
ncbi:MAG: hypothetical protein KAH04_07460 [Psychrilyobacter sp.]|nr:hypothetical protein [Psychrilyobacter sp.]